MALRIRPPDSIGTPATTECVHSFKLLAEGAAHNDEGKVTERWFVEICSCGARRETRAIPQEGADRD